MRHWIPLLVALATGCGAPGGAAREPSPPRRLPDAVVSDLEGRPASLAGYLHGRAALVALWATWCDACFAELGALNRLEAQARQRPDAVVIGIAVGDPREQVVTFASAHGLTFPLLVDTDFALADALGERRVPTTLVVDRAAHVVHRGGALDEASLAAFRDVVRAAPP